MPMRDPLRRRLVAAASTCALLAGAAPALADGLDVTTSAAADAPDRWTRLSGGAVLSLRPAPEVSTRVGVSAQTGDQPGGVLWPGAAPDPNRAWRDLGVDVQADWASERASLKLQLAGGLTDQPIAAASVGEVEGAQDRKARESAGLTAALRPLQAVSLSVTGRVASLDDQVQARADDAARMSLHTRDGSVDGAVHWAVAPALSLDAGARLSTTTVAWRQGAAAEEDYMAVQPRASATLSPAPGASWRVAVEHAVSPLDAGRFITLARADALSGPDRLAPDQEWRVQGEVVQALPAAGRLRLAVTQARTGSATELVRLPGDVEGPGSVRGGVRRQVDVALTLPLAPLGLAGFALETSGAWRDSQVQDPLTGGFRRASGEAPYEGRVALAQSLPVHNLRWGLDARTVGVQSWYGLQQVSTAAADQTLGAFVEYRPRAFTLRLQVDNLAGGERRWQDALYAGDRGTDAPYAVNRRTDGGPALGLSLKKAL